MPTRKSTSKWLLKCPQGLEAQRGRRKGERGKSGNEGGRGGEGQGIEAQGLEAQGLVCSYHLRIIKG